MSETKLINDFLMKWILIHRLTRDSLEYYVTLQSESHRDAWTNVLILLLTKLLKFNEERVWSKTYKN
jgi:hypothetical protein